MTKQCSRCLQVKLLDQFGKESRSRDGHQYYCKQCVKEWRAEKRADPQWVKREKERASERYYKNREKILQRNRTRNKWLWHNDPEYRKKKNEFKKQQYHNNPVYREKRRTWAKKVHEREQTDPVLREKKKVRARWTQHVRRARLRSNNDPMRIKQSEWAELCERYNHTCLACGTTAVELVADHVIPISKGGRNVIENIQPLCRSCNAKKYVATDDYRPTL